MDVIWNEKAWLDYLYWQTQDKKTLKRINDLIKDINRNGYNCKGKLEKLKGEFSGWRSVRIDGKNRIVFRIEGELIRILECRSHYGDK